MLTKFRASPLPLGAMIVAAYVVVNDLVNALSVLSERSRQGPPVERWEPFVWELSSGLCVMLLFPLVAEVMRRFPITSSGWKRALGVHLLATLPFCLLHVLGMVALRRAAYAFAGRTYDFGDVPAELVYEWRKDVITYFVIVAVVQVCRWWLAQVTVNESVSGDAPRDRFQIGSKRRRLPVSVEAIDWIEAAGNYVILHIAGGQHMVRETLKTVSAELDTNRFVRVHRCAVINLDRLVGVNASTKQVLMPNGAQVPVSRACWTELAARLAVRNEPAVRP